MSLGDTNEVHIQKLFQPSSIVDGDLANASVEKLKAKIIPQVTRILKRLNTSDPESQLLLGSLKKVSEANPRELKIRESDDMQKYLDRMKAIVGDVALLSAPREAGTIIRMDTNRGILKTYELAREANPGLEEGLKVMRSRIANAVNDAVNKKATYLQKDEEHPGVRLSEERSSLARAYLNDLVDDGLKTVKRKFDDFPGSSNQRG